MDLTYISLVGNGVMGIIMYLWKRTVDTNKEQIAELKRDVKVLETTRMHKEDFKDFKADLTKQFDEIKQAIRELHIK